MKHFEELWVKAESVAATSDKRLVSERVEIITNKLQQILLTETTKEDVDCVVGEVLFQLCGISTALNINTFTALLRAMQDAQISTMEDD